MIVTNRLRFDLSKAGPDISYFDGSGFVSQVDFRRQVLDQPGRCIVGFIHGYNVSWEESIIVTKVVQKILPDTTVVGFSWPSSGSIANYLGDRSDARVSAESFAQVVVQVVRYLEKTRCHKDLVLIAHSMGNYLLARAAKVVWELRGRPQEHTIFREVVMLAPDLDSEDMESTGEAFAIPVFGRRVTIYYSRRDGALLASSAKRIGVTGGRLGRRGVKDLDRIPSNVVAVDCTEEVGSHSGYFSNDRAVSDLRQVVAGVDRDEITGRIRDEAGSYVIR